MVPRPGGKCGVGAGRFPLSPPLPCNLLLSKARKKPASGKSIGGQVVGLLSPSLITVLGSRVLLGHQQEDGGLGALLTAGSGGGGAPPGPAPPTAAPGAQPVWTEQLCLEASAKMPSQCRLHLRPSRAQSRGRRDDSVSCHPPSCAWLLISQVHYLVSAGSPGFLPNTPTTSGPPSPSQGRPCPGPKEHWEIENPLPHAHPITGS